MKIRTFKKLVKKSMKLDKAIELRIKDESEEDGNLLMLASFAGCGIELHKFTVVSTWCGTPIVAVPYWKIANPHIM